MEPHGSHTWAQFCWKDWGSSWSPKKSQVLTGIQSWPWHLHPRAHTAKHCKSASPVPALQGRQVSTKILVSEGGEKKTEEEKYLLHRLLPCWHVGVAADCEAATRAQGAISSQRKTQEARAGLSPPTASRAHRLGLETARKWPRLTRSLTCGRPSCGQVVESGASPGPSWQNELRDWFQLV